MATEDSSDSSLNPWGLSFGGLWGGSSNGGGSANGAGNSSGNNTTGTLSRAAAKKHPLASSPSPRSSHRPGSPSDYEPARPPSADMEHELTPETSVVVHPVTPTDTFSSIALRYGTDVNTILRANRLWQGDAPQMRAEIFIPLLNCKRTPPDTILRAKAAIASSSAAGGSRSPSGAGAAPTSVLSSREGPGAESLPSATASTATAGGVIVPLAPGFTKPTIHSQRTASSNSGSGSGSKHERASREGERDWKPNKWTLGGGGSSSGSGGGASGSASSATGSRSSVSGTGPSSETASNTASSSSHHHSEDSRRSTLDAISGSTAPPSSRRPDEVERASTGWNDAPAPNARIARAYQGGTRRGGHHRLLQDLAAGLPPNTGAAANWQRPINDSLPVPPGTLTSQAARAGATGAPPRIGSESGGLRVPGVGPPPRQTAGLGKILSDTFRGRMSVEDAFEAAIQSVSASVTTHPTESTPTWASYRTPDGRDARVRATSPQPGTGQDGMRTRLARGGFNSASEYDTVSTFGSVRGSSSHANGLPPSSQPSPPGHELERLSFEESSIRAEKWEREQERLGLQGKGVNRLHPSAAASSTNLGRRLSGSGDAGATGGGQLFSSASPQGGLRSRGSVRNMDWATDGPPSRAGSESSTRTMR